MNALSHWFAMHGYAPYIWSAYGLVCSVLIGNLVSMRWQRVRIYKMLQQWFKHS